MEAARAWREGGMGADYFVGIELQCCKTGRVLEMDVSDGCTTV